VVSLGVISSIQLVLDSYGSTIARELMVDCFAESQPDLYRGFPPAKKNRDVFPYPVDCVTKQ
jgi:hypothetical protein